MRIKLLALAGALIFAGALATGCSDDDNGNGGTTINLGLLAPLSGTLEGIGLSMKNAAEMAADEINKNGGLFASGDQIKIIALDDGTDATVSSEAAKKLVDPPNEVVALVGPATSGSAAAVQADMAKLSPKVVLISGSATSPALSSAGDNFFRTVPTDSFQGDAAAFYAASEGKKAASVLYIDNTYGKGLAEAFKTAFEAKGTSTDPNKVLAMVSYPEQTDYKTYDFTNEAKAVFNPTGGTPDLVFMVTYNEDGAKFTKFAAAEMPTPAPLLMGCDGNKGSDFISQADATVIANMVGTAPAADTNDPNLKAFNDKYKQVYSVEPKVFSVGIYDAVYLLAYAMEKAGKADRTVFTVANLTAVSGAGGGDVIGVNKWKDGKTALDGGKEIDYKGAAGDINWDNNGDVAKDTVSYEVWRVKGSTTETIKIIQPE
jgi:branched-chain amino acid transport system substrate-binding protein